MDSKAEHGTVPPTNTDAQKHLPVVRPGFGSEGRCIRMLSNYFRATFNNDNNNNNNKVFYQYSVSIKSADQEERAVEGKGIGRKIIDKLYQAYSSELVVKEFAYDGEKCLYTVGPLPQNKFEFLVLLEESHARATDVGSSSNGNPERGELKRSRHVYRAKGFKVTLSFAAKIPIKSIASALEGIKSEGTDDALRVLDIILRQQHAKKGCLLVRQSFFNDYDGNLVSLGGGVSGCKGFHMSYRTTHNGLALNMDVSTTTILTPGPVINFLFENQNVRDPRQIDWAKAKRMLKNMRVRTKHNKMEFKITGFSELPCRQQTFTLRTRTGDGECRDADITVEDYFARKSIHLSWSANAPCLNVGRPNKPNYIPIELCDLVSLQRYTKSLSKLQRASLVEKSRQKPHERIKVVTEELKMNRYSEDPMLAACGISIEKQLVQLNGRVLNAPMLKVGDGADFLPRNGRWNFNNRTLWSPINIDRWAIVNFSARCDLSHISRELIGCGRKKGILIERPFTLVEEDPQYRRAGPVTRVEEMFKLVKSKLPGIPQFLLCVLPERKNSDLYGPWKKKNLHEEGIVTQCIAPQRINDHYLTNLLLKINAKLGGINSILSFEHPLVNKIPTLILGMDVSHGSPGRADVPSIAAVVGSRCWPSISRYGASVRSLSPKTEMIDCLYKLLPNGEDDGIMREILIDFYQTSSHKPLHVIFFRDGVSESQFGQVLDIELEQIKKTLDKLGVDQMPRFTVIVAQKNHHTRFFLADSPDNIPPGTVVDTKVVHPRHYDFFMCAHAGILGTSRPTHYHVLLDEIGFSADDLQKLVHSLSYVYQRSTSAVSMVAPVAYAHLAAQQMTQFVKFEDLSDNSSSGQGAGGVTSSGPSTNVPKLPDLHSNVRSSMFFC